MADNLGDYGNFWSGDYWNSRAKAQRDRDRAASSQKLAKEQNDANVRDWGNIGSGLGVKGFFDNLINSSNQKPQAPKSIARPAGQSGAENLPYKVPGGFHWPAGDLSTLPPRYSTPSANGGTRQGNDDIPESNYRDGVPQTPLEILMEKLNQPYTGPDASQMDFSSLDKALSTRLGMLGDARKQIEGNHDKSDLAVQLMHDAFRNEVQTKDAARYNQIADTHENGLRSNLSQTTGNLEAARAKAVAERTAMLKNLGQEQAGAAVDTGNDAFNRGINTANERQNSDMAMAEGSRANNLSYNNTVAQSIGLSGIQRRAALEQQLQGLLGKVTMAESEAKASDQTQRQQAMSGLNDTAYKHWNDQQDRYQHMFDTLTDEGIARDKMGMSTTKPTGQAAIAQGLVDGGTDPETAQKAIAILNKVLSGGNYMQGAQGTDPNNLQPYDKKAVLAQKLKAEGLDDVTAGQTAMLYGQ